MARYSVGMIVLFCLAGIVIAALLAVCIWFTVGLVQILAGIKKATTATGHCVEGQTACDNVANEKLGFPTQSTTFSTGDAKIYADLVGRLEVAAKNDVAPTSPPGFTLLKTLNDKYGDMFVGLWTTTIDNATQLYIVFRGTKTMDEWKKDLQASQVPWPIDGCQIHKGFNAVYQVNRTELLSTINTVKPSFIAFTGHSLGAAIATLASLDMAITKLDVSSKMVSYVFASPRVGNVDFAALVNKHVVLFRIVNSADLVNDIPFPIHPNVRGKHIPFIYQHAGISASFNINWGSITNNHLIPIYKHCLDNPDCTLSFA